MVLPVTMSNDKYRTSCNRTVLDLWKVRIVNLTLYRTNFTPFGPRGRVGDSPALVFLSMRSLLKAKGLSNFVSIDFHLFYMSCVNTGVMHG